MVTLQGWNAGVEINQLSITVDGDSEWMNIACCSLLVSRPKGMAVGNGQLHFPAVRQYGLYILGYTFLDDNKEMSANNFFLNQSFVNFSEHNELE